MPKTYRAKPSHSHKQGDTFDYSGPFTRTENGVEVTDFTGWTGKAELRDYGGSLIADLNFTWTDITNGLCRLTAATDGWDVGRYQYDVELVSPAGSIISTPTVTLNVVREVTQ